MKVIIQRVLNAKCVVNEENVSEITISANITPTMVANYSINKTYYVTIDVKENEAKHEN